MSFVSAIVVAAGKGERLKSKIPKPLFKINKKPVIIYSLEALNKCSFIKEIIIVGNSQNIRGITRVIKEYRIDKALWIVKGGLRRQDSVKNGLGIIDNQSEMVLIHDAARPFIDVKSVSAVIAEAKRSGAAILGVPVKATVKELRAEGSGLRAKHIVKRTLDRNRLWEIQTPQVFRKDLILKAYNRFGDIDVTDDAMLVEKLGAKVSIVPGLYKNIKITTPEDLLIAQAILKA